MEERLLWSSLCQQLIDKRFCFPDANQITQLPPLFLIQSPVPEAKLILTKLPGFLPFPDRLLFLSLPPRSVIPEVALILLPFSLFHLSSPPLYVFMICRHQTKTNLPLFLDVLLASLPYTSPLQVFLLPFDILLLFTSNHNCIYLSCCSLPSGAHLRCSKTY